MLFYGLISIILLIIILVPIGVVDGTKDKGNVLYKCNECKRYFRFWQSEIFSAKNGFNEEICQCPHCLVTGEKEKTLVGNRFIFPFAQGISDRDKEWLESHPDCPSSTFKKLLQVEKEVELYRRAKSEEERTNERKEYNQLPKSDWLERLEK